MQFVIRYSRAGNAAYIQVGGDHRLSDRTVCPLPEDDDIMIDVDANGQLIGIELLGVDEPVVHVYDDDDRPVQRIRPHGDLL